ncbi:MAG: aminoglycoside phosphotransferase family protein [Clostridia bacterium]|nr:aminoglycoside phosphotransferase family protein [Clostridia bacterium]
MKVERIQPIPLTKEKAIDYARLAISEQTDLNATDVKYLGGGSFGMAFGVKLDDQREIVVKFLRAKDMLKKEVFDLKLLGENRPVKFPKVLFARRADEVIPIDCYAMDIIQGKSAFIASLTKFFISKRKKQDFADKVTCALHEIHKRTNEKFGDTLCPDCDTWLDYYKPFAKAVMDKAEEMYQTNELSEKIITTMRSAWSKFDEIFSEEVNEACLIHGDLNLANIMVDNKFQISGFIDPLNSAYADREYDLFQFDNLMGKRFALRKTYINKYGASKNCDIKCAFYGLWNEVYCYVKSGMLVNIIMNPLVKNMKKLLAKL